MPRRKARLDVSSAGVALFFFSGVACSTPAAPSDAPSAAPASSGGTGGGTANDDVTVVPTLDGWVDRDANPLGLRGAWYAYGDRYDVAKCVNVGLHQPAECSLITSPPPPPTMGFPNTGGSMCTTGETAVILPCNAGVTTSGCPDFDYSNMWGAGIGFDFSENPDPPDGDGMKATWDPDDHGIVGVSFVIDHVPNPKLRVEFPMRLTDEEAAAVQLPPGSSTDDHPDGAPYWGADASFSPSPVLEAPAVNVIRWDAVRKPGKAQTYVFDRTRLLGIQFHVPAVNTAPRGAYAFCVRDLTFLRH